MIGHREAGMATELESVARRLERGPRQTLVRAYERIEASRRGYVWLSKLGPAYLFGLVALVKAWALSGSLARLLGGQADLQLGLLATYEGTSGAFFALIAALYLIRRRPMQRVRNLSQALVAVAGCNIMFLLALNGPRTQAPTVLIASSLLTIVGVAGAVVSLAFLGRCFGVFPEARGLVTRGPYRLVRHPVYLFEFIAFLGAVLPALTPTNAMLYVAFVGLQLSRAIFEEQILASIFPDRYAAYCARTARLIPGLY
jgi:protein-S-isoprenylcysteine O-methyltransferase Ste14